MIQCRNGSCEKSRVSFLNRHEKEKETLKDECVVETKQKELKMSIALFIHVMAWIIFASSGLYIVNWLIPIQLTPAQKRAIDSGRIVLKYRYGWFAASIVSAIISAVWLLTGN